MNPHIITFTATTFALFILYVEGTAFRNWLESIKTEINGLYGHANYIYPTIRAKQSWMRENIIQTYK